MTESVVESANSGIESANFTAGSAENPLKIGLWVRAFSENRVCPPPVMEYVVITVASYELITTCCTQPTNQNGDKQRVGIFHISEGENAVNRRAQYGRTGRGGEWLLK